MYFLYFYQSNILNSGHLLVMEYFLDYVKNMCTSSYLLMQYVKDL